MTFWQRVEVRPAAGASLWPVLSYVAITKTVISMSLIQQQKGRPDLIWPALLSWDYRQGKARQSKYRSGWLKTKEKRKLIKGKRDHKICRGDFISRSNIVTPTFHFCPFNQIGLWLSRTMFTVTSQRSADLPLMMYSCPPTKCFIQQNRLPAARTTAHKVGKKERGRDEAVTKSCRKQLSQQCFFS